MTLKIAVTRERAEGETRVALSPDTARKFVSLGARVVLEAGAGEGAGFSDQDYAAAGAAVAEELAQCLKDARVVLTVNRPHAEELALMPEGAILVGCLDPYDGPHDGPNDGKAAAEDFARAGVDAFAMEFVPRISRAQSMDVLSSQANLAGYKAVMDAAAEFPRAFPMMMTAAGTIAPARVFVLGAGVAGLQAIATARRLGAIVSATDVRPVVKEQVESLGASFVMVAGGEAGEGGYAREMGEDYRQRQAALVAEHLKKQDIVITTALIPGRPAPRLLSQEMVESMRPGSVIVDLAVERGGNCPLSRAGEIVLHQGVKIIGHRNVPGRLPVDASALYARNLYHFLAPFIDSEAGTLKLDPQDELVSSTALTRGGQVVHPSLTGQDT